MHWLNGIESIVNLNKVQTISIDRLVHKPKITVRITFDNGRIFDSIHDTEDQANSVFVNIKKQMDSFLLG